MRYILKKVGKIAKRLFCELMFIMTGRGPCADEMVDAGVIDLSGQGRS